MTKKITILLILLTQASVVLLAFASHEEIFQRGVNAYEERNYELALRSFLDLEEENIVDASLFYNIGNTYFRLNKTGYAILYFKKGLKIEPHNSLLQNNLNYLLSLTTDRQITEETNPFIDLFRKIVYSLPFNTLLILTLVCFALIVFIINIVIMFYNRREKTIPLFVLTIMAILFVSAAAISYYRWQQLNDDSQAVLLTSSTSGYSGPAEDYTNLFHIHEGMVFTVNRTENEWSQITLPAGITGWIRNDSFKRVTL